MSGDHSDPAGTPTRFSRAKDKPSSIWQQMTNPACADFIDIPHDGLETQKPNLPNRTADQALAEFTDYYRWCHF